VRRDGFTEAVVVLEIASGHDEYRYERPTRSVTALQSPRTYRSSTPWVARRSMISIIASKEPAYQKLYHRQVDSLNLLTIVRGPKKIFRGQLRDITSTLNLFE